MIYHSLIKKIFQSISMMTCGALVFAQVPNQAIEQLKILQQHFANPQDVGPDKNGRQYAANDTKASVSSTTTNSSSNDSVAAENASMAIGAVQQIAGQMGVPAISIKQPEMPNPFPEKVKKDETSTTTAPPPSAIAIPQVQMPAAPQIQLPSTNLTPSQTSNEEDEEIIDQLAFEQLQKQMFPMTPKQIQEMRKKYQDLELAKITSARTPPKPVATSQFVNLSPGSTPPVIRLAQGFVTSLVFLDSSGAPWPISAYDVGDPSSFNIQWDKSGNTLMIQAMNLYNYGNMAVRLEGLNTPVMLTLIPGQKLVDYRIDMRVQGYGPHAKVASMVENLPASANNILLHILDGVPPTGSQRLTVSGGDARAWLFKNKMYVRTNLTVLSPAWMATMVSADGTHAYEMQKAPVLLVSWHGKVMQLKVEGL
jgi:intracellular multiplication protein IcmK